MVEFRFCLPRLCAAFCLAKLLLTKHSTASCVKHTCRIQTVYKKKQSRRIYQIAFHKTLSGSMNARFVKHEKFYKLNHKSQYAYAKDTRIARQIFLVTVETITIEYQLCANHRIPIMRQHVIGLRWVKYVTLRYVVSAGTGRLHL